MTGHLDRADAEDAAHIHDADAAQLDKVADDLGRGADQGLVRHALDLDRIVRDQAVSALDQLDGCFGLADARIAQQQHAFAVDLDQHAVQRYARGEVDL